MKRYVVAWIKYQHAEIGDDDAYSGWQSFYTTNVFSSEKKAKSFLESLRKDRFVKDSFMAIEV